MNSIDDILLLIRARLDLEAETETDVLEEIRTHLEEAVAEGRARGLTEAAALTQAAARFGVEEAAQALQVTHAGWGALEGIAAAVLPVLCALTLRWLVFAPDGTAVGWREVLTRPAFWAVALLALFLPLLRFPRRRYALISWGIFWGLSVLTVIVPTLRW